MKNKIGITLVSVSIMAQTVFSLPAQAALNEGNVVSICATKDMATKVSASYGLAPGAPLAVISRMISIPEVQVATGVSLNNRSTIKANPQIVKDIWSNIEKWGKDTTVRLIFTMGGSHVADFPSLVPMAQDDLEDGWLDIFADEGRGVHGHLWLERINSIHAIDIEGKDHLRTRTISFYGPDGKLILGLYASIAGKKFDHKAVEGFTETKNLIASMPQICDSK